MITRLFLLALFFHYLLIQRTCGVCPNEDFITPCSCMTMAVGNHVLCLAINSTELLSDIFRILSRYDIHTLVLSGLRVDVLSSDIFDGLKVEHLRFEDSVFRVEVGVSPFRGLEDYLTGLDVFNCHIGHLEDVAFTHLTNLNEVSMNFDSMGRLKASWFQHGPLSVRSVQMDHNGLEAIESGAFLGLTNLEKVSLADNKLQTVNRDVFPTNAGKLSWIDLSYNMLQELPTNIFSNMPRLKRVVLTRNQLTTLPQVTWGAIWNRLEHLIIKDNPIVCDNEISWAIRERVPPRLNGSCKSPKELTGRHLAGLTLDQLQSR